MNHDTLFAVSAALFITVLAMGTLGIAFSATTDTTYTVDCDADGRPDLTTHTNTTTHLNQECKQDGYMNPTPIANED